MDREPFGDMLIKFRHVRYGDLSFHAICPKCGKPVKVDDSISILSNGDYIKQPNATCFKCGRVEMPFDGELVVKDKEN
jgi:hypothetical protein